MFCDPMDGARQASLSFTVFQSLLKLMSIELVMPSDHLMLPARSGVSKFSPPSHETVVLLAPPLQQLSELLLPVSFPTLRAQIRPLQGLIQHFPKCHPRSGGPTRFLGGKKEVSGSNNCFTFCLMFLLLGNSQLSVFLKKMFDFVYRL